MPKGIPGRPDLLGSQNVTLRTIPTRVLRTEDAATTDAQRQAQSAMQRTNSAIERTNDLSQPPFGSGELLTESNGSGGRDELLTIAAGDNDIPHTLGHPVNGFVVCDMQVRGDLAIYRISVSRSFDERFVRLHSAHAGRAKIWVW